MIRSLNLSLNSLIYREDVYFKELVADTMGTVQKIYDKFGFELTDKAKNLMLKHLEYNRQHKHGKHHYSPEQFGLDTYYIRDRFKFYTATYDLDN